MRPKGKLLALFAMFAAVGLITATGAFTTVEAQRTAEVNVAGDSAALLQLEPANGSEFASANNGEVEITLDSQGVNSNATTVDDEVLNITNNGNDDVFVQIDAPAATNTEVVFYNASTSTNLEGTGGSTLDDLSNTPSNDLAYDDRYILNSSNKRLQINSGNSETVGIYVDTHGADNSSVSNIFSDGEIIITAESTDA